MKKKPSFLGALGWGMLGDILLLIAAMVLMMIFSIASMSNAYLIALAILFFVAISVVLYRKYRKAKIVEENTESSGGQ